jgi:hypothetical protein
VNPKYTFSYETEPISSLRVSFSNHDFRRNVLRRSTDGESQLFFTVANFGQAKISDFNMPLRVQQYIFWLQISVDYISGMQILDGQQDFGGIELGDFLREFFISP